MEYPLQLTLLGIYQLPFEKVIPTGESYLYGLFPKATQRREKKKRLNNSDKSEKRQRDDMKIWVKHFIRYPKYMGTSY